MACPSDQQIADFIDGKLQAPVVDGFDRHLDECGSCRQLVASLAREPGPQTDEAAWSGVISHYELGRELARGGMGRIHAARDLRLERPVAVKQLLRSSRGLRRRFEREVRITARLQHPAIVPVYEAGRLPDGEPFYAMRLVEGRAIDQVLAERPQLRERLALLPSLIAACDAVAYAHSQGIIHRDLKPANVLLGAHGETVVIDWGLAKDLRGHEASIPPSDGDEVPADPAATAAGTVLGTAAYMPPEQAGGGEVDERADVYALGALLYHAIAAAPPYRGSDVLEQVKDAPPALLAERAPGAPPDLVAIIEHAMARDPQKRYPTASALTDDLKRFQTGLLVEAHRYSLGQLIGRFFAKHRAAVATAAIALVLGGISAVAGVLRLRSERDRAERQLTAAEKLVQFVLVDLRDRLDGLGRLDLLGGVGAEVDRYYAALPTPTSKTARSVSLGRARAYTILGDVEAALGKVTPARVAYERAIATLETIPGKQDRERDTWLGSTYVDIGVGALEDGAPDRAVEAFDRGRAILEPLIAADPGAVDAQKNLGQLMIELGQIRRMQGKPEEAKLALEQGRALLLPLPRDVIVGRMLNHSESELGALARGGGDAAGALRWFGSAVTTAKAIHDTDPGNAALTRMLGLSYKKLGQTRAMTGANAEAVAPLNQARELLATLVAREPKNMVWLHDLGSVYDELGRAALNEHKLDDAEAAFKKDEELMLAIVALAPENLEWQADAEAPHTALAEVAQQRGRSDEAVALVRAQIPRIAARVAKRPDNLEWASDLANVHCSLGEYSMKASPASARDSIDKCLQMRIKLSADHPDVAELRGAIVYTRFLVLLADARLGRKGEARAALIEARKGWDALRDKLDKEENSQLEALDKQAIGLLGTK